jgi:hypothetical protein
MILDQFEFNDAVPNGMFGFAPRLLIGAAILPRAKAFGQDIGRIIYSVIIHARLHGMVARGRSGHRRVVVVVVGRHGKASCRRTTATGSHGSAFFGFDHSIVGVEKTRLCQSLEAALTSPIPRTLQSRNGGICCCCQEQTTTLVGCTHKLQEYQ